MTISRPYRASLFWPIPQGVALGWYIAPLQGCYQPCRESFVGNFVAFVEGERLSGWSKTSVPFKSGIKSEFRVGASHLHFVSTPCLHALSDTLRLHTLSLRFVESPDTEVRCYENSSAEPGGERGTSSSSIPGTADPAGTAGTAGGWRHIPATMPHGRPNRRRQPKPKKTFAIFAFFAVKKHHPFTLIRPFAVPLGVLGVLAVQKKLTAACWRAGSAAPARWRRGRRRPGASCRWPPSGYRLPR